jgi:hypothetical protein
MCVGALDNDVTLDVGDVVWWGGDSKCVDEVLLLLVDAGRECEVELDWRVELEVVCNMQES